MALIKSLTLPSGVTADYWRIVRINHVSRDGSEVILGLFLNTDIGDNGILDARRFSFDIPKSVYTSGNCYEWIYEQIKASSLDENGNETNWFADAEDAL